MTGFYTRQGDEGTTGLLSERRVPKFDLIPETLGTIDEINSIIGLARSMCRSHSTGEVLLCIQRDLYAVMSEIAAAPDNSELFRKIGEKQVKWLEEQITSLEGKIEMPGGFIVPGDTTSGAVLDMARTAVRRAERRVVELKYRNLISNPDLLRYMNRLSSLFFILELFENNESGLPAQTLAKI